MPATMECISCGVTNYCGCAACKPLAPPGATFEQWIDKEIGLVACGDCGFSMRAEDFAVMSMEMGDAEKEGQPFSPIILNYLSRGKMPGERGYKPSLIAHWRVKLGRWSPIFVSVIKLLVGLEKPQEYWRDGENLSARCETKFEAILGRLAIL